MLKALEISVSFGDRTALEDISLELGKGKVLVLLGPNGAGKTTLIKTLNGTVKPSSGKVILDGKPIEDFSRSETARQIAVVAQENETRFPVTVLEFVLSGRFAAGTAFGWETVDDITAAKNALSECDLAEMSERLMNELSGGERQRVVLARALATGSKILLLDEPTANLDLAHQAAMFRLIQKKCVEGYSAVVITHDLNLAAAFADTVLMLENGRVFAAGTPRDVLTETNIADVFGIKVLREEHPATKNAHIVALY